MAMDCNVELVHQRLEIDHEIMFRYEITACHVFCLARISPAVTNLKEKSWNALDSFSASEDRLFSIK